MLKSLASLGVRSVNSFSRPFQSKFNSLTSFQISSFNVSSKFQTRNYLHWISDIEDDSEIRDTLQFLGTLGKLFQIFVI